MTTEKTITVYRRLESRYASAMNSASYEYRGTESRPGMSENDILNKVFGGWASQTQEARAHLDAAKNGAKINPQELLPDLYKQLDECRGKLAAAKTAGDERGVDGWASNMGSIQARIDIVGKKIDINPIRVIYRFVTIAKSESFPSGLHKIDVSAAVCPIGEVIEVSEYRFI